MPPGDNRSNYGASSSNKLINLESEDGWFVVSRKSQARHSTSNKKFLKGQRVATGSAGSAETNFERLHERLTIPQMQQIRCFSHGNAANLFCDPHVFVPAPALCSAVDLQKRFDSIHKIWIASASHDLLKNLLRAKLQHTTSNIVSKAICLGLGSPSNDKLTRDSMWQLVVFIDIAYMLTSGISLVVQDPVFNHVDKEFLQTLKIEVVESPAGFSLIDNTTFVFAPHFSISWWPTELRTTQCPFVVGNSIEKAIERTPDETELLQIFRSIGNDDTNISIQDFHIKQQLIHFQENYSSAIFPAQDAQDNAFTDIRMYWPHAAQLDEL